MSDELLVLVIGLLGGFIGALGLAFVWASSDRRHRGAFAEASRAADVAGPSALVSASFMRVDLLRALHDTNPFMRPSVVDGDDLDLELRLLLGRYGKPSGQ